VADLFQRKAFADVNLEDPFFDSLKASYEEFEEWFHRKHDEEAYLLEDSGSVQAFLYLKVEEGAVTDVIPPLPGPTKRVKIGTFKVNPHGTRLGERCVKKALDYALSEGAVQLYVTVFAKHRALINLLERYGFKIYGKKVTRNGCELVLVKSLETLQGDVVLDYPLVDARGVRKYLLAIYPQYHTNLFPDSILNSEPFDVIDDRSTSLMMSHTQIAFTKSTYAVFQESPP